MIIKTAVSFLTRSSNAMLLEITNTILSSMTGNPSYPTPLPGLSDVANATDTFTLAVSAAVNGGKREILARDSSRVVLVGFLRSLAGYVQLACGGDMDTLVAIAAE